MARSMVRLTATRRVSDQRKRLNVNKADLLTSRDGNVFPSSQVRGGRLVNIGAFLQVRGLTVASGRQPGDLPETPEDRVCAGQRVFPPRRRRAP